jgi:septal ring factor EnvC (AmiA/AmiB activator)
VDATEFQHITSGVESIAKAISLLVAGGWVLYTFWALLSIQKVKVDIEKVRADTEKTRVETEKSRADTEKTRAETDKSRADIEKSRAEIAKFQIEAERIRAEIAEIEQRAIEQPILSVDRGGRPPLISASASLPSARCWAL